MAKHQHKRSHATDNISPYPYHDEMHRQFVHQKRKPNLQNGRNTNHIGYRKTRNSRHEGHHLNSKDKTYSNHRTTPMPYNSYTLPDHYYIVNATEATSLEQRAAERERIRVEFFSTYDVMTGVRIATTLGGFFGLMVFLVVYKSRGERLETIKALNDPKIAAVAAAVMQEEEERELQEAIEATGLSIFPEEYIDPYSYRPRKRMMSLGNVSAPPRINQTGRFASIGGYSSLLIPTKRRFSYAGAYRKSNSVESPRVFSAYPIEEGFAMEDFYGESDGEEADDEFDQMTNSTADDHRICSNLTLSQEGRDVRRLSNITCCSSESSYLERRCSALTFSPLSAISSQCPSTTNILDYFHQSSANKLSTHLDHKQYHGGCDIMASNRRWNKAQRRRSIDQESFDSASTYPERDGKRFFYDEIEEEELAETTVLAQQINKLSLKNRCLDDAMIKYTLNNPLQTNLLSNRRAPLASISSLKMSSTDYQDSDIRSPISDSIFNETYADTDDDMEQFSIDSDDGINQTNNYTLKKNKLQRSPKRNTKTIVSIERTDYEIASTSGLANQLNASQSMDNVAIDGFDNNTIKYNDNNEFLSEPNDLHINVINEEPPKLHTSIITSGSNVNLRMPYKTSYSSSSSQTTSSCHSST